jgi:hypothetical protein
MAKTKINLTNDQKRRNAEILARLAEEEARIFEDTRALQREWKSSSRRRRSGPESRQQLE